VTVLEGGSRDRCRPKFRTTAGFTLIELLTVIVVISILAAIAQPRLRKAITQAKAAEVIGNLNVVKVAVFNYQADHNQWPGEAGSGAVPSGLAEYLPGGFSFVQPEYRLDYENWTGTGAFEIGVSVVADEEELGRAVMSLLRSGSYSAGSKVTWVLVP